ncbi:protein BCL9 homolog isoform X1 [Drosophila bipectinata]|uniref:protein BCL9 homolog isoform X1 n=1 Tax=Drosophila bipectinata TaxID=42026 RepID=UPI001C8ACE55|nr:protein BCL9 homolog isoform X1 [Drosophila bipectinata]XP_043069405.1 protein BCL9 homolog isoform X1 [Drosophila bipectinata]XP_043069406.1 protein BCL9 homolog isoform X1 [Drosophila bipectinata]XP_043069407.1 protein BCL9 homolog isoform X1 [Drosophila bipectinata]
MAQSPVQAQPNTDASSSSGTALGMNIGKVIAGSSSPKQVKNEPFSTTSPEQSKIPEEISEKAGTCNEKSLAIPTSGKGGVGTNCSDGQSLKTACVGGATNTPILRQNSSSSVNSCLGTSPNTSELSNSSNLSSVATAALNQIVDSDVQKEDHAKKKMTGNEENMEKTSCKAKNLGSGIGLASGLSITGTIKEEPADILNSLVNIKKEERENLSPSISPVGFGSIGLDNSNTSVKIEMTNNLNEKALSMTLNNEEIGMESVTCNQLNADVINESLNNVHVTGLSTGFNSSHGTGLSQCSGVGTGVGSGGTNTLPVNPSGVGNCLDYMQQQNHIYVFSTQLANKGAESVLNGHFQTIIAYHCTQPATKSFLEDFFMKNPLKMNKLQRHGSLGMPWIGFTSGGSMAPNSSVSKTSVQQHLQPKSLGNLKPPTGQTDNLKRNVLNANNSGFTEQSNPLSNDSDLMCWESGTDSSGPNGNVSGSVSNSQSNLDGSSASGEAHAIKLLEAAGVDLGAEQKGSDSCLTLENNIVSLQGVKVPDENLTPQQRQHREEQLAKIKKMNQFLFPEHENSVDVSVSNHMAKLPGDIMIGASGSGVGSVINPQLRQMTLPGTIKPELISGQPSGITEDAILPIDVMADIGSVMACNNSQKNSLQCGPGSGVSSATGGSANTMSVNMQSSLNSTDLLPPFGNTSCSASVIGSGTDMPKNITNQEGLNQGLQTGVTQMEWSKLQQQFFDERLKCTKVRTGATSINQQSSVNGGSTTNNQVRSLQGPPPPYHSTQRSASVPIDSQSPNPSSPNNSSLPSPRTTGTSMGLPSKSPNIETSLPGTAPASVVPNIGAPTSTAQPSTGVLSGSKNCFQGEVLPSLNHTSNRNRNNGSNNSLTLNLNSNPGTPLSHISPKDLEQYGQSAAGDNIKNRRPSSHAPRSPGTIEANVDSRFASSSPGLIFNHHSNINNNPSLNAYKMSNSNLQVERQSSGLVGSVQFNRRSDNIPLNPNGNRSTTNKIVQNFDPISSLAQMSQQLTSCVSGVGSPVGTGGISMISGSGSGDLNMEHGMISSLDAAAIDVINQNSCHSINPMMNSLGQRMLNPKMCAPGVPGSSFNANSPNSVIRDFGSGPISGSAISPNFQNVLPPGARLMGRMPVNFGSNFNPNIQVKASTPNTIQYMPVRPQNNSNNNNGVSNVRMPPSLEFLQRYANPQMTSVGNGPPTVDGGMLVGTGTGAMIVSSPGDQPNKISNQGTGNTVNFYQNCNQLALMEEDGSLTGHDVGMGIGQPSIIRGMRPHSLRPHATGPRIQNSVNRQIQFSHNADTSECDGSALFNGPACSNTGSNMFSAPQQSNQPKPHHIKTVTSGICQNQTNVGGQIPPHGQGQLQNLIGPSNNNLMATTGNSAPQNGSNLNFVGPSPSDIKYAQQYHSFQQQLYATNTRSQQQQIQQQGNIMAMSPNLSPNPAFFVNK